MMAEQNNERIDDAQSRIVQAHGGGGELTARLIDEHIIPRLANDWLNPLDDAAVLASDKRSTAFTTDSYVVQPLEFPGGDIGRLAVCGTVNDLAVMGAEPVALSLGLILEEGLPLATLDRVLDSIAKAAREAGVRIVTGDTKVVDRRGGDGMFINTAGIGYVRPEVTMSKRRIEPGDRIIVSGPIGEHGLVIMSVREGIEFDTTLKSDAAPLNGLVDDILRSGADVRFMRDPTRGGLAGVVAEISSSIGLSIQLQEQAIPVLPAARRTAELLGLDVLTVANEGKLVMVVAQRDADRVVEICRDHPRGGKAAIIGQVVDAKPPLVELHTAIGGRRIVQRPYGEELPRIC